MKAISIGKRYEIYDDSLKAYDKLPAKTYTVRFAKMSGFFSGSAVRSCSEKKRFMAFIRKKLTRYFRHL